jgi:hypothetical protein
MHNSIKYLPNTPQYIAIMHGPVLLGMKTGTEDLAHLVADDSRFGQYAGGKKLPVDKAPILINNDIESIATQLTPIPGKPLHFRLSTRMENAIDNELQPFFEIHDSRYMMYWLALTEKNYKEYIANLPRRRKNANYWRRAPSIKFNRESNNRKPITRWKQTTLSPAIPMMFFIAMPVMVIISVT